MAGSISLSLSQRLDNTSGKPLSGGLLYFYQAGTTSTPQNAFQDSGPTIPWPNPITLDAGGNIPAFYLADGQIKIRLTNADGVTQVVADGILVVGPSSGEGSGGSVDATTVFQTGDVMWLDVSGPRSGWVRDNGRTIGSAASGATERANADCEALFGFLWQKFPDTICPVSSGRGVSSAADWAANKYIKLPDKRGCVPGGLADMGGSDNGEWDDAPEELGDATTAGSILGESTHTLAQSELPNVNFTVTIPAGQGSHSHSYSAPRVVGSFTGGGAFNGVDTSTGATTGGATLPAMSGTAASGGFGTAQNNVQRTVLGTFFRKL